MPPTNMDLNDVCPTWDIRLAYLGYLKGEEEGRRRGIIETSEIRRDRRDKQTRHLQLTNASVTTGLLRASAPPPLLPVCASFAFVLG